NDHVCVAVRNDWKMVVTALWVEHNDDIGMPIDVALGSLVKSQNPATFPDRSGPFGNDPSKLQNKDVRAHIGIPSSPSMQNKPIVAIRPTTSGSSGEQPDDEEVEGEINKTKNMTLVDAKRVRRMLSNRESDRCSRRRKQTHLTELGTQVSQLRSENSSLLKRFIDVSPKYNNVAIDNRVLKVDVETLRVKDSVKTASTEISSEVIIETFHNDDEALAASDDKVVVLVNSPRKVNGKYMAEEQSIYIDGRSISYNVLLITHW
ncbi:Light-inducible protein CPRF2, partial [Glycine soja]